MIQRIGQELNKYLLERLGLEMLMSKQTLLGEFILARILAAAVPLAPLAPTAAHQRTCA